MSAPRLVLRRGRLPGGDAPVDVWIEDGILTALTPTGAESESGRDGPAREVDLDGRWVIPGLWDNHVHFTQWACARRRLDLSGVGSAAEAVDRVLARLSASPSHGSPERGEMLVGFGFQDALWPDAPSLPVLDAVSGPVPVVLIARDLHCCWLNSAALAVHGHLGHPTGLLREGDCFAVLEGLQAVDEVTTDRWAGEAGHRAAARGVVGIVDLEWAWNREVWQRRVGAGQASLRVEIGVYPSDLNRAIGEGLRTGDAIDGTDGLVMVGPFKVITDGSLNTRTAFCFDEYSGQHGRPDAHGLSTVGVEELVRLMRTAWLAGLRPAVHAIGDRANDLALTAFAQVGCPGSIEHAQLLMPGDAERFAALGVIASVQPEHAMDDRDVADRYWRGRTDRAFTLASLLAAGATLALGSDAPVAPLDPWIAISAAVARSRDGRAPWHPEQALSVADALTASVRTRVAAGEPADLAIVETDPLTATADELRRMPVGATLLAGRFTHNLL